MQGKGFSLHLLCSKALDSTQINYTITKEEMLDVAYAYDKLKAYQVGTKVIGHIDHTSI